MLRSSCGGGGGGGGKGKERKGGKKGKKGPRFKGHIFAEKNFITKKILQCVFYLCMCLFMFVIIYVCMCVYVFVYVCICVRLYVSPLYVAGDRERDRWSPPP